MKRFPTYLTIVTALAAAMIAVPIAQAAEPSPAELTALEIRGQGLNELCGDSTIVGSAYTRLCGTSGAGNRPTEAELRALEIRGQALNELAVGRVTQVASSSGFDWSDFGIGAGAMLGFVLLAGGIAAGAYYGRRDRARPRPVS